MSKPLIQRIIRKAAIDTSGSGPYQELSQAIESASNTICRLNPTKWDHQAEADAYYEVVEALNKIGAISILARS